MRCEHFRAMFLDGYREAWQSEVVISNWSHESYQQLLEFLYTGHAQFSSQDLTLELLGLADSYDIKELAEQCELALIHQVDLENVLGLLAQAHRLGIANLKKHCVDFLLANFNQLSSSLEELEREPALLLEVTRAAFKVMHT